jgi:hypothetical protein
VSSDVGKVLPHVRSMFKVAVDCIDVSTEVVQAVGITLGRAGRRAWAAMVRM